VKEYVLSNITIGKDTTITFIGHATVLLETPAGKRILIDPWTIGNPACPQQYKSVESLGHVDLVLVTHIHADHVGDLSAVLTANTGAFTVCVPEVAAWLQGKGHDKNYSMNIGGALRPQGIDVKVSMTQAFHTSSFTDADGTTISGGVPVGFVLEFDNGFTIYDAGDTGVFGDMALIKDLYHPDLAILPIGDHFTMGPRLAAAAARMLGVKYVLPVHFATFPVLTGTPEQLRTHLGEASRIEVIDLAPGESIK
jgi:L-ascorbate metabolism protein UlaG (beta-lactamase superfamily)